MFAKTLYAVNVFMSTVMAAWMLHAGSTLLMGMWISFVMFYAYMFIIQFED